MINTTILRRLLHHRGSIFSIKELYTPGKAYVCPRCSGKGEHETAKSDCRYNTWTETVSCDTCRKTGRVDKTFAVEELTSWSFRVSEAGVALGRFPDRKKVFLSREEAGAEAARLNKAEKRPK